MDFSFFISDPSEDTYFLLGRTIKVASAVPAEVYYLKKSDPVLYLALATASGLALMEPLKKIDLFNEVSYIIRILYN